MKPKKTALIAGATGLVGRHCLELLLGSGYYDRVVAIGRQPVSMADPKLEQLSVDFDQLEMYSSSLTADDVYCCLGTTIKKAGSKERFRKVDQEYVLKLATITAANFATQFLVVSALGAHARSAIFYNQVKGQMEEALKQVQFRSIHIFQPSLLLGDRSEFRLGERVAQTLMTTLGFLLVGPLRQYRPIEAETVARAMLQVATQEQTGIFVYPSEEIKALVQ